jgi:peptidoglycan/xylan/chitin deacetylase (PgdA/CDA1 family)
MILALRIDVDSLFGLSRGVPRLLAILDELDLKATFFIPMGPDKIGRNAARVFKENGFQSALGRYRKIYPWQLSLAGTLLPARDFCEAGLRVMLKMRESGHYIGTHSYDHFGWQSSLQGFSQSGLDEDFKKSIFSYAKIFKELPRCCAAPAWRATRLSLQSQEAYGFDYASDTRGIGPFYPVFDGLALTTLQVPVTMPTLDEVILQGKDSVVLPQTGDHVYCGHAETDGLSGLASFRILLESALSRNARVISLSAYANSISSAPGCSVKDGKVPGRASAVAVQVRA